MLYICIDTASVHDQGRTSLANTFMFVSSAKAENDNLAESSDDGEDDVPAAEKRTASSSTESLSDLIDI